METTPQASREKKVEMLKRLQASMEAKKKAEFDGLMQRFFNGPLTDREREIFDFAYGLSLTHCMECISEHAQLSIKPAPKVN